jgi:predicted mannosyl-3-phosphoglycerate phosphatase (HAD superfamily)
MVLFFSGILASKYLSSKDNKIMAKTGMEQCLATPDRINSTTIWVRNCDKYMKSWKLAQDKY